MGFEIVTAVSQASIEIKDYDALKENVKKMAETYKNTQYDLSPDSLEKTFKAMKADRAELNKVLKNLSEKKKEVKDSYMKPFTDFEAQVQELKNLVEEASSTIDAKVKSLEEEARAEKAKLIRQFYDEYTAEPDKKALGSFKETLFKKVYDPRWENTTSTVKAYKEGLTIAVNNYIAGMMAIQLMDCYKEEAEKFFQESLDLAATTAFVADMKAKAEILLQKQRERIEDEAKAKAEAEAQAEIARVKAEAEAKAKAEAEIAAKAAAEAQAIAVAEARVKAEAEAKAKAEAEVKAEVKVQAETAKVEPIAPTPAVVAPVSVPVVAPNPASSVIVAIKVAGGKVVEAYSSAPITLKVIGDDASISDELNFSFDVAGLQQII